MMARLLLAMLYIFKQQQWLIEKHLFSLSRNNTMLLILAGIAFIPLEPGNHRNINHNCILS